VDRRQPVDLDPVDQRGLLYMATDYSATPSTVEVYDENGVSNCAGSPKVCQPVRTVALPDGSAGSVVISNGVGYVETGFETPPPFQLVAFDATGTTGCAGSPVVCQPLWTATLNGEAIYNTPAVAAGRLFVPYDGTTGVYDSEANLAVFDANGSLGCTGTPKACTPLTDYTPVSQVHNYIFATPEVTSSLLLIQGELYDAAGSVGCTGTSPSVCASLWTSPVAPLAADVANGTVFVLGNDGSLHAYRVPGT
jgi:hypothetical protein